jgi:hypothetical protein
MIVLTWFAEQLNSAAIALRLLALLCRHRSNILVLVASEDEIFSFSS